MNILLWLEGPLQAWGTDSRFGRRDTLKFPSRSGITGLIISALGARGSQEKLLQEMIGMKMTVHAFRRKRTAKIHIPLLQDFHMVGSGYNDKHSWEKLCIPKKSDGTSAVGGGSKLTYRYYLQDAVFAVIIEASVELGTPISDALKSPMYALHLGRKCCVPSDFVYQGSFNSVVEAEQKMNALAEEKELQASFKVVEGDLNGDALSLNDVPVRFGETKKYRDRIVTIIEV